MKGLREDEKSPEQPPRVVEKVDEPRPAPRPETPGSTTP